MEAIEERNLYHVLTNRKRIEDCIFHTYLSVDVLPATPILSRIEVELARDPGALLRFPTLVRSLDYDYVVIDTPPSISFALTAALYTCDVVISPVSWSRWTIQGYSLLKEECDRRITSYNVCYTKLLRGAKSPASIVEDQQPARRLLINT